VVTGLDGIAVFDALHRRRRAADAMLYALTCWGSTARIFGRCHWSTARRGWRLGCSSAGIVFNEHTDEDGATVFEHACRFGFEGIVSKRLTAPYRSGPSRDWLKIENPDSPAVIRHREGSW
jgi:bifunctional non-homologous end joining protein LigD